MPGMRDSHVEMRRDDFAVLRILAESLSGTSSILPRLSPAAIERLESLSFVMLLGGQACITARGVSVVEASPLWESPERLTFRARDLVAGLSLEDNPYRSA